MRFPHGHLAYCTNIHPAETWLQTFVMLRTHVLAVRNRLRKSHTLARGAPFAIGLRLSAHAARELLATPGALDAFRDWLSHTCTYICSINGFPYGNFHGGHVKERVFQPDWTQPERLRYTQDLFRILVALARPHSELSVSTVPGSHKHFRADEAAMRRHLAEIAQWLDDLSQSTGHDLHLGLEPEPLGHIENTEETLSFFDRLRNESANPEILSRRIGVNYDACHFAIEFDSPTASLDALAAADIRLSKIHLSNALALSPHDLEAIAAIRAFEEPTYFHQVLLRHEHGEITRFPDLPDFLVAIDQGLPLSAAEARVHFHIPLDSAPAQPLASTLAHTTATLDWCDAHPTACRHFEIETYTWGVLPTPLGNRSAIDQIVAEYRWVLEQTDLSF